MFHSSIIVPQVTISNLLYLLPQPSSEYIALVFHFIEEVEAVKREPRLAPTSTKSFFLTVSVIADEVFVLYLKPVSHVCSRSHFLFTAQESAPTVITSLSTIHSSFPLHRRCCNIFHLKSKNSSWSPIPLHSHSYFFGLLMAKQYSQIVTLHWL